MATNNRADNTIKDSNGYSIDVYDDDMYMLADDYINSLPEERRDNIYNTTGNTFTGLIKYINRHINFSRDILADINILNNIWDIYTDLVYKYNQKPTIMEYCILIGINTDTIYSWLNGETRANDYCEKLGSSRSDTIKKWQNECKMGRYKSAASGNVGGIFLCKAVDGMVETAPVQVQNTEQIKSIEQIAQEHGAKQITESNSISIPPKADF